MKCIPLQLLLRMIPIRTVSRLNRQNCSKYGWKLIDFAKVRCNESQPWLHMLSDSCRGIILCNHKLITVLTSQKQWHVMYLQKLSKNFYCSTVDCFNWKSLITRGVEPGVFEIGWHLFHNTYFIFEIGRGPGPISNLWPISPISDATYFTYFIYFKW